MSIFSSAGFHAISLVKLLIRLIDALANLVTSLANLLDVWHQIGVPWPW
jgi:hypothetical protein